MTRSRLLLALMQSFVVVLLLYALRSQALIVQIAALASCVFVASLSFQKKEEDQKRQTEIVQYRKLLVEKKRADLIAASISDGILLLRNREVVYANSIAEKILDLPVGVPVAGFDFGPEGNQKLTPGVEALIQALSSCFPAEFVLRGTDRIRYYLIQSQPLQLDPRSVDEISSDDLEPDVLVLAQDITLLKESQEAKIHFLGTLSHEVKTPVTSLTMAIHLLKKTRDQFPNLIHRNLIATCAEDIDRLRALIDDLMTVSRFDILAQRLELQKIDLGKLLSHAVQSFRMQAQEKEIELTHSISVSSESPEASKKVLLTMDATKIAWALSNLLTNALRHTPRGGKVGVSLVASSHWAEVRVKDTGPGIELHRQERIFEKFNPYYDLRVARSGVAGAGLAIAKEIVNAHQGEIWVTSQPGAGAEFGFRLPLDQRVASVGLRTESLQGQTPHLAHRLMN